MGVGFLVQVTPLIGDAGEVQVGFAPVGPLFNGLPQRVDRLGKPLPGCQEHAEVIEDPGIMGTELQRASPCGLVSEFRGQHTK